MARALPVSLARYWCLSWLWLPLLVPLAYLLASVSHTSIVSELNEFFNSPGLATMVSQSLVVMLVATVSVSLLLLVSIRPETRARVQRPLQWLLGMPHVAFALGLLWLFSPIGWVWRWFGVDSTSIMLFDRQYLLSLILILVLKELPFLWLMGQLALKQIPVQQWLYTGKLHGQSSSRTWWLVIVPELLRRLRLSLMIVAVYSLTVVDIALIAGPQTPPLLAVQIYQWYFDFAAQAQLSAQFGTVLIVALACLTLLYVYGQERLLVGLSRWQLARAGARQTSWLGALLQLRYESRFWHRSMLTGLIGLTGATILALTATMFARGWFFPDVWPQQWTTANLSAALPALVEPLLHTIVVAILVASVALITVVLMGELQRQRQLKLTDGWVLAPLLVPQIALVLGWQFGYQWFASTPTWVWLLCCHLPFSIAYSYAIYAPHERAFRQDYMVVAQSLGRSYLQAWWQVKRPLLAGPLRQSFGFAMLVSIAQYLPTQINGGGYITTLTTEFVTRASGGASATVALYGLLLTILAALVMLGSHHASQQRQQG